jgi:hypothetical protein
MVRLKYQGDIDEIYAQIKESACGRQACTVLILIANEVLSFQQHGISDLPMLRETYLHLCDKTNCR